MMTTLAGLGYDMEESGVQLGGIGSWTGGLASIYISGRLQLAVLDPCEVPTTLHYAQ